MLVNRANLDALFTTYLNKFTEAQKAAATRPNPNALMLEDIALAMTVTGAGTVHSWMEQIKSIHEWIGDRNIRNIKIGQLTVTNRDFENTISVKRNDIEDDQYGMFAPLIGMMGADAETLWIKLAVEALVGNGTWADGNVFFCSGRVMGDSGALTNAVTTALSKAAVEAGITAMQGWLLAGGEPADVLPDCLVVGPSLEATARQIIEAELVNDGNNVQVTNVSPARRLKLRVSNRLVGAHAGKWFITATKGGIPLVAVQKRKLPKLVRKDQETDENVFMKAEFLYGTDARGESFLTLPFLGYAGGLDSVAAWAEA
jgi:phage major head subunit gpT-like protein